MQAQLRRATCARTPQFSSTARHAACFPAAAAAARHLHRSPAPRLMRSQAGEGGGSAGSSAPETTKVVAATGGGGMPQQPPKVNQSRAALLMSVERSAANVGNVYGKPLTKSEQAALQACITYLQSSGAGSLGVDALREHLLTLLQEAAIQKNKDLAVVEGAMVILEQLYMLEYNPQALEDRPSGSPLGAGEPPKLPAVMTPEEQLCRWQLVIGADVGAIQYIPAVEELQAAPGGQTFNLDTDLNFLFTGFSGDSSWLSPGHLRYHVQRVRIELRYPKGWARAEMWWSSRRDQARVAMAAAARGRVAPTAHEPDWGWAHPKSETCRPNPNCPAVTLPLPFPPNELFTFCSNYKIAAIRSKLGGLILLLNVHARPKP